MLLKSAAKILKQHQEELTEQIGLFAFVGLKSYLENLLDCNVDLVTKNALHPALKSQILREAKYVF